MALPWAAMEKALRDVVAQVVPTVVWAEQGGPVPAPPHATLRVLSVRRRHEDSVHPEGFDASRVGQEVELRVSGAREVVVRVRFHTTSTVGEDSAQDRAAEFAQRLELETVRETLWAAGLGVLDVSGVTNVAALQGVAWQGRAEVEVTLSTTQESTDFTTYIETADVSGTATG